MRQIILLSAIAALSSVLLAGDALSQGVLYRCESDAGISIQGAPCPKGVTQRKIAVQQPADAVPVPATPIAVQTQTSPLAQPSQPSAPHSVPLTPASAMHGPNDPYPLWECMRADGSTFDSRDGIAGKQWVVRPDKPDDADDSLAEPAPAQNAKHPKAPIVRQYAEAEVSEDAPRVDHTPPPPGTAPGQWVADQCTRLEPQQACERFATRRNALRKQIYAAKPSERATYAPEEQDLTSMLFAACGR